jgi:aspartate-semialdehyde dehydrogenase
MIQETRKIMHAPELKITATCVRVPVMIGHSESINIEFEKPFELPDVYALLSAAPGLAVIDDPARNQYPMPIEAAGSDTTYVGRIRRDFSIQNGLNIWVVADNTRKGAASNAVQIAELLP